jgi:hypothetical protein
MDLIDLIWNTAQQNRLNEVRDEIARLETARDLARLDARQLAEENAALRLRLGLLVRLLITKAVFTAQEYAALIAEARPKE